jgi:hypothetical protein
MSLTRTSRGRSSWCICGAGIGRTGMFTVAVLMSLGLSNEEARLALAVLRDISGKMARRSRFMERSRVGGAFIGTPSNFKENLR